MIRRLLVSVALLLAGNHLFSQISDTSFWSPNGTVNALLLKDSLLFAGGDFDMVSPVTGRFIRLDSATAAVAPGWPVISGSVYCMAKDHLGRLYVGGSFNTVGAYSWRNLFRLLRNGQVDPSFHPDPSGPVYCIDTDTNFVYFGGDFTMFDGNSRSRGAAIKTGDAYDSLQLAYFAYDSILPFDAQANGAIYAIQVLKGGYAVAIGGEFTSSGGSPIPYLELLYASTGNFYPYGNSFWAAQPGINGTVRTIREYHNKLYVGGDFTAFASIPRMGIGVVETYSGYVQTVDLNNQPAYDAAMNGTVRDIEILGDKVYVGGKFGIVDGNFRSNLTCLDTLLHVLAWNPFADKQVFALQPSLDSSFFYVAGDFHYLGTDSVYYAGAVDTASAAGIHNWNPWFDGAAYTLMPDTLGHVYAGGVFNGAGGVLRHNLCAINVNTGRPVSWKPVVNNVVHCLYNNTTTVFVSGTFSLIDQQSRIGLAAFDLSTFALTAFNPGTDGLVRTMCGDQSRLYVGGNFSVAGGQARANLACIDIAASAATAWNPGCSGTVNKIIADNNWLYVGGFFPLIGGQPRQNLARVSLATGVPDWFWQCDADNGIYTMDLFNGNLYFGGWFTQVAGQGRAHIAAADTLTGALLSFNPMCNNYVHTFARYNDDLFVSGDFDIAGTSLPYKRMAAFDIGNGQYENWAPYPDLMALSMQATAPSLYAGGSFHTIGYNFHPFLAKLSVQYVTAIPGWNEPVDAQWFCLQNPAADMLTVRSHSLLTGAEIHFSVFDIAGNLIQEGTRTVVPGAAQISVDIRELDRGMYFIRLAGEQGSVSVLKFQHQ